MSTTAIDIAAPAAAVYESLLDAWTYEVWVKGAKRIRDVDRTWPAPGSCFHHSVGVGPLMTRDRTRLLRAEPNRLVELEVRVWPVGQGRVRLDLSESTRDGTVRTGGSEPPDTPRRTHVTMTEVFDDGPAAWWDNTLQQVLIKVRNDWSLDALRRVVEQRYRQTVSAAGN